MVKTLSGTVHGRVQGVGFRYFTKNKALELGIRGWVRNNVDGSVEFQAQGNEMALEQFMHSLMMGPIGSRVESTQFQWSQESEEHSQFEIRG
ncbi:MAG TPA: acylphosphatase [bacterium]|nr:acylphosphatase [bacterium]